MMHKVAILLASYSNREKESINQDTSQIHWWKYMGSYSIAEKSQLQNSDAECILSPLLVELKFVNTFQKVFNLLTSIVLKLFIINI